jgi:hypothetical protein
LLEKAGPNGRQGSAAFIHRQSIRELLLLADALKAPDEVWVRLEWQYALSKAVVRRRYKLLPDRGRGGAGIGCV